MNKKIKVIELLNRIYANLDVPEKVKYNDKKYEYNKATQDYRCEDEWLFQRMLTFFEKWTEREIEILEDEEEEIDIDIDIDIDIESIRELPENSNPSFYDENSIKANRCKINEILREVKQ